MHEHEDQFDDPQLKQAVRRAVGRETAPASLRARIEGLVTSDVPAEAGARHSPARDPERSPDSSPVVTGRGGRRLVIDRQSWRVAALAACVLLAVGWMVLQVREQFFPESPYRGSGAYASITSIPASLVQDLVKAHSACARLPDHHLVPGDNPEALREKLSAQAGVTVSATTLSGGWTFKGAGVCKVGERTAAHLLFVREDDYVSIFSMPAPESCGHGMESYRDTIEKHAVAGFTRGDGLYCVVGSSAGDECTTKELDPVLEQVKASIAAGCMTHETVAASATPAEQSHP